jgi:Ca-activated chloride channel family protein
MDFLNPYYFLLLLIIPFIFLLKNSKLPFKKEIIKKIVISSTFDRKKRFFLFILSYIFLVIALARPVILKKSHIIKINSSNIIVLLSGGEEMNKKDIYPTRYDAAISKLKKLFSKFTTQNVSVLLVLDKTYLISPFTTDYDSVIYLLKHINKKYLFKTPANFKEAFNVAEKLDKKSIKLAISDKYFNHKNTISYIFSSLHKDKGIYFSYSDDDIQKILKQINTISISKTIKITNNKELFHIPLIISLILFFIASFSLRRKS